MENKLVPPNCIVRQQPCVLISTAWGCRNLFSYWAFPCPDCTRFQDEKSGVRRDEKLGVERLGTSDPRSILDRSGHIHPRSTRYRGEPCPQHVNFAGSRNERASGDEDYPCACGMNAWKVKDLQSQPWSQIIDLVKAMCYISYETSGVILFTAIWLVNSASYSPFLSMHSYRRLETQTSDVPSILQYSHRWEVHHPMIPWSQ